LKTGHSGKSNPPPRRAVVFANGLLDRWPAGLRVSPRRDLIVAADGGLRHCAARKIRPHLVVGDLDSADPQEIDALEASGIEILRFPAAKDRTDLELALRAAIDRGASPLLILGALGARGDKTLGNALLLAAPFLAGADARILDGDTEIRCLRGGDTLRLPGRPGDLLSLLPLTATAIGITLKGLTYPLENAVLELGSTRGLSNVLTAQQAQVSLRQGSLLAVLTARNRE